MTTYSTINKYVNGLKPLFDVKAPHSYVFSEDNNGKHTVELQDANGKLVLKAEYSIIGTYNLFNNVWYWAWNIVFIDRQLAEGSEKVRAVGDEVKNNYKKLGRKEADELHYMATNGNFMCQVGNVEKVVDLGMFVMKSKGLVEIQYDAEDNVVQLMEKGTAIKRIEFLSVDKVVMKR